MPWLVRFDENEYDIRGRLSHPAWILPKMVTGGITNKPRRGNMVLLATYGNAEMLGSGVILSDPVVADEAKDELQFAKNPSARSKFDQPSERVFIDIRDRYKNPVLLSQVKANAGITNDDPRRSFVFLTDQEFAAAEAFIQSCQQPSPSAAPPFLGNRRNLSACDLLHSGLVGMWAERNDISDSREFACRLREQAQTRRQD